MLLMRTLKILGLLAVLAALSGCAASWVVDSDVGVRPSGLCAGAGYRFESGCLRKPLPTRAHRPEADLEAMAAPHWPPSACGPTPPPALQRAGVGPRDARVLALGRSVGPRSRGPRWQRGYGAWGWGWRPRWYGGGAGTDRRGKASAAALVPA